MIPAKRAHLHVSAVSHPGMKGKNNEDKYAVSAYLVSSRDQTPSLVAIVSDGIGGHRAGEVASEMAVEIISKSLADSDASQPEATLQDAIIKASEAIRQQAASDPAQKGMGGTCACVWIIGDRLYTATVGDSRIYLIRNGEIRRLSTDHTWVQEAMEHGALTPEQARRHPNAHVIRRYLGSQQPVIPDLRLRLSPGEVDSQAQANQGFPITVGDHIIICTDGLTDLVDDPEILAAISSMKQGQALDYLVSLANERGGHDNITIVDLLYPKITADRITGIQRTQSHIPVTISPDTVPVGLTQSIRKGVRDIRQPSSTRRKYLALSCLGVLLFAIILAVLVWTFREWIFIKSVSETPQVTQPSQIPLVGSATETKRLMPTVTQTPMSSLTPTPTIPAQPTNTLTPWPTITLTASLPSVEPSLTQTP